MKCLLIMAFIFINGMDTAEQRSRQPSTFRDDDLDGKAKAWLLMVESGKADEEESHTRRITPKSIFIAPLLSSRSNKACKEGYRHDHLGQCVKVIKLDQRAQLELLLKRLSAMYGGEVDEGKGEGEEAPAAAPLRPLHASTGPLHFSLPISGDVATASTDTDEEDEGSGAAEGSGLTEEVASSGSGPADGSGTDDPMDAAVTLIPDELDDTDPTISDSTTTVDTPTTTATDVPYTTMTATEAYDDVTTTISTSPPVPSSPPTTTTGIQTTTAKTITTTTRRPTKTTTTSTTQIPWRNSNRIVFPDSRYEANRRLEPVKTSGTGYRYDVRKLPTQQLWWLQPNWRIDDEEEDAPKPAVYKFWSHLPLIHDPSFDGYDRLRPNEFVYHTSTARPFTHRHHTTAVHRQGRVYTTIRPYTEVVHQQYQPRRPYHMER